MLELRLTRRAKTEIEELPAPVREPVLETLALIALHPEEIGKRLVGRPAGLWSARVGSYRILYTVDERLVIIRTIRHRATAYPPRPRRRR